MHWKEDHTCILMAHASLYPLQVRPGTGGDEASLFAADLLTMYVQYAEQKGWSCEVGGTA